MIASSPAGAAPATRATLRERAREAAGAGAFRLLNARLPAALAPGPGGAQGGLADCDILIDGGRIAALAPPGGLPEADAMLARLQNDLFDLGADLAVPGGDPGRLRISDRQCARLEAEVAAMNAAIPPLRSFILPGGTPGAAQAHLARTVARRAEREFVQLSAREALNPVALRYLNRMSDHLFVMARHLNENGARDVLWIPGQNY